MATIFQQLALRLAPAYLVRGPMGSAFTQASGIVLDFYQERLLQGIRAKHPLECDANNLPAIAAEVGMPIYQTEPIAAQRSHLTQWKQLRRTKGNPYGAINHVRQYFIGGTIPTMRIVWQDGAGGSATWVSIDGAGNMSWAAVTPSNWNWDGQTSKFARWWAIVYLPQGFAAGGTTWDGSGVWNGSSIWDGVPAAVIADLWQMFYDWKSAGDHFGGLIVTALQPGDDIPSHPGVHPFDPTSASTTNADGSTNLPTGSWGASTYLSGPSFGLPTRPSWALFFNLDNG